MSARTQAFIGRPLQAATLSLAVALGCAQAPPSSPLPKSLLIEKPQPSTPERTCLESEDATICHDLGVEADEQGDDVLALTLYTRGCELGSPYSCHNAAVRHFTGRGTIPDVNRAVELFDVACRARLGPSCFDLCVIFDRGRGVKEDHAKAFSLCDIGCDEGVAGACYNVGVMYATGRGVASDLRSARTSYEKACEGGDGPACANLGLMLVELGDLQPAVELYGRGCSLGNGRGCALLALALWNGRGVDPDPVRARAVAEDGCRLGEGTACYNLAHWLESGPHATELLRRACELGVKEGCGEADAPR